MFFAHGSHNMGSGVSSLLPQQVFATSLYTGTGAAQTITNGLDLAGQGGLVWRKRRDTTGSHNLQDTVRGFAGTAPNTFGRVLKADLTNAEAADTSGGAPPYDITAYSANGFTIGPDWNGAGNTSAATYAAWSFRRAPKFFDVVTYTGNGVAGRQIAHNLGIAPGMIGIKRRDAASALGWYVYHTSLSSGSFMLLNATAAAQNGATNVFGNGSVAVAPTSTNFTIGNNADLNASGGTYVAYLFAHDPDTVNGIVQCGSYTAGASASTISLGWQPQFLLIKCSGSIGSWFIIDASRGFNSSAAAALFTDTSQSEASLGASSVYATSTGFVDNFFNSSGQMIFLAIRAAY